jgi:type IV secretory pathway TraG/TraD family ATPase VirD4
LLNTRFMFRQPDPDMAKWAANNFGESFIDEVREGTSYGANTIRDGISINRVETRKQVVSYSEVMSLSNLYAYVRLPGKFPITLVDFVFKKRQRRNIGFLSRDDFDDNNMKKMDNLIDTCTALPVGGIGKATKFSKKKSKESVIVDQEQLIDV